MVTQHTNVELAEILRSTIVWDNHGCMPLRPDSSFLPQLERYRSAGVNVVSLNIGMADQAMVDHILVLSFMRRWLAQRPESYRLVSTVEDINRAKREGTLAIVFDIEGMCPVQEDLSLVQTFYELGVRWMLIAYNRNNAAGGGCLDVDCGLTDLGRSIIDEMERVGMVLCLSHAGRRTVADALEYAHNPCIFSHSNPYGDTPHARNVADDLMRACARKGGIIGLNGFGAFLGTNDKMVERLVRQLRYSIDLVGAEHVGLGLDYVFDDSDFQEELRVKAHLYPPGVAGMNMIPPEAIGEIAECMARANFLTSQIRGVLGENWLRIAQQVWK